MAVKSPGPPPSRAALEARLGASYPAFAMLLEENPTLRPEWKYYGPRSGWTLKLFDGRRNLCFISPAEAHFTVAFLLGERAAGDALKSRLPDAVRRQIREARAYVEGRGVRVTVKRTEDLSDVRVLLDIKRAG